MSDRTHSKHGGRMTISPPANVKTVTEVGELQPLSPHERGRALLKGFDTLTLAIDVTWADADIFKALAIWKAASKANHGRCAGFFRCEAWGDWTFNVAGYGHAGYEYMIEAVDMTWKMGDWLEPCSRPSIMIDVRSETLWTIGRWGVINRIRAYIEQYGGRVEDIKVSRADVCADILIRDTDFKMVIIDGIVCRAVKDQVYRSHRKLQGIGIGAGGAKISARIYDKPQEIEQQSGKKWFYDLWGGTCPAGHRIIRVEFQIRREKLVEMNLGDVGELFDRSADLWDYCTRKWLRIVDDNTRHHTMQTLRGWWRCVQRAHGRENEGVNAVVLIKSVKVKRDQVMAQLVGQFTSWLALDQDRHAEDGEPVDLAAEFEQLARDMRSMGNGGDVLANKVRDKLAKHKRIERNIVDGYAVRSASAEAWRRYAAALGRRSPATVDQPRRRTLTPATGRQLTITLEQ